jgi:HK97 gp10 family phage protein
MISIVYKWHPEKFNEKQRKQTIGNLWRAALMVERDAKLGCPVDTGRLRASLISSVNEGAMSARVGSANRLIRNPEIAVTGSNVYYAKYVELGTYKMKAQPFLVPALEKNKPAIRRLFGAR